MMTADKSPEIRVIPRVEHDGTPILFLPEFNSLGCYAHVGQHSAASLDYYRTTRPARNGECDALLAEYASIPPQVPLKVLRRMPPFHGRTAP